jgi:iron only hydrogenase large subunit-like protein
MPKKIEIPDSNEAQEFEQVALRQARANIKRNEHCLTLERLVASAYVEGFVHCFEVFSEMLREGNIKR